MIGSLRGVVLERGTDSEVLLEVGGVGYFVTVTPRTLAELEPGANVFVYVHHHIREDAQTLFGFLRREERATFQVLIGTHGVGPSMAMAILGTHTPSALIDIVASADNASLCMVPGVGKKTPSVCSSN
jgi:Holliday junction DNA helicase RuvA